MKIKYICRVLICLTICATVSACVTPPNTLLPNFCTENGGAYEERVVALGTINGFCVFNDRSECNARSFYEGKCKPEETTQSESTQSESMQSESNQMAAEVLPPQFLDDLIDKSDVIVYGTIGDVLEQKNFYGYDENGEEIQVDDNGENIAPGIPITRFALETEVVYMGDEASIQESPIVLGMGGHATAEMKEITSDTAYPFSYTGDEHLFLLTQEPDQKTYGLFHGPRSRLIVEDGLLYISNGNKDPLLFDDKHVTLEEFLQAVQSKQ